MKEIKEKIKAFIIENFLFGEEQNLEDDMSFLENGIIDSTGVLELVEFIENTFSISIEDEDLIPENLDSLQKVANFINSKKS